VEGVHARLALYVMGILGVLQELSLEGWALSARPAPKMTQSNKVRIKKISLKIVHGSNSLPFITWQKSFPHFLVYQPGKAFNWL
jgi:hypothetical protein